jgi:hypothetical protein
VGAEAVVAPGQVAFVQVTRLTAQGGARQPEPDVVAVEAALELRVKGTPFTC